MSTELSPLKISGLTKKYGKNIAVNNISLELSRGDVFGFLGPNGAGKSTTIRAILNFLQPTSGSIEVFSLDSVKSSRDIMRVTGYLAGDIALYENMTGKQLIRYLSSLRGNTDFDYANSLAERFQATLDKPIRSLSKGNKQKIGLIQAFMSRPELVILDEPTSGLDPLMKQTFYEIVRESSATGSTIFLSSHDLTEVQKICNRVGFIRAGELVSADEIGAHSQVSFRQYTIKFSSSPPKQDLANLPGVTSLTTERSQATLTVSGHIGDFLRALNNYDVLDLESNDVDLEDIFMHYYRKADEETK